MCLKFASDPITVMHSAWLACMYEYSAVNNSWSSVIFRTKCLWSDILSGQDVTLENALSLVKGMTYREKYSSYGTGC